MNDMGWTEDADAPEVEPVPEYQLYWEDVDPCRWFLSVNGGDPHIIKPRDLNVQGRFRDWHLEHHYKPPSTEKATHKYEQFIERLFDCAIKRETPPPFLQTNAHHIETLIAYFDVHIPTQVRRSKEDYLDGKHGDYVRANWGLQRLYFKWQQLKRFMQRALNAREQDIEEMKLFIMAKGGYQGEQGARDWFRWTYYVPLDLFDEPTKAKWFEPEDSHVHR